MTLNFVSPPSLAMPDSVKADASRSGVRWEEFSALTNDVIARSDVLYATRVQRERFDNLSEYESVKDMFVINNDVLAKAKESAIVMHPLPRLNEIDPEVDFDSKRAAYFRQMRYGLFVSCLAPAPHLFLWSNPTCATSHANQFYVHRSEWRCSPSSSALEPSLSLGWTPKPSRLMMS